MRIQRLTAVALVAGLGLVGTAALAPAGPGPGLLVQEQKKAITVTGVAIGTDGQPAPKLPVAVSASRATGMGEGGRGAGGAGGPSLLAAQDEQNGRWKVVGKGVTDASGRFTIKNIRETGTLRIEIGRKEKSDWKIETVKNDGSKETIDVGEIELQAKVAGAADSGSGGNRGNRGGRGH